MPELPEVETVCRLMSRVLKGKKITGVKVAPDEIVLGGGAVGVVALAAAHTPRIWQNGAHD